MILWREVKKAISNPLRTDFTVTRGPALLVNNNRVGILTEGAGFAEVQTLLPSFPTMSPKEKDSQSWRLELHGEEGNSIKQ